MAFSFASLLRKISSPQGRELARDLGKNFDSQLKKLPAVLEPFLALDSWQGDIFERAIIQKAQYCFFPSSHLTLQTSSLVAMMLLELANHDEISSKTILDQWGEHGLQFIEQLEKVEEKPIAVEINRLLHDMIVNEKILIKQLLTAVRFDFPEMPALSSFAETYAQKDEFKNMKQFFCIQHLMASTGTMLKKLQEFGIPFEMMQILGKVYSTHAPTAKMLEANQCKVDPTSSFLSQDAYDWRMERGIFEQLSNIIDKLPHPPEDKPIPQALIMDDGGEIIRALHTEKFKAYAGYFTCVEQTRKGIREVHRLKENGELKCAVVNVAECYAKLTYESPLIAYSIGHEIERKIDALKKQNVQLQIDPKIGKPVVVINGYGAVGQMVAAELVRRGFHVCVYDNDPQKLKNIGDNMTALKDRDQALSMANMIVSCVGDQVFKQEDIEKMQDGTLLFNASSSDLDFRKLKTYMSESDIHYDSTGYLFDKFLGQRICLGHSGDQAHSDMVLVSDAGHRIFLANNGYVINMTGEADPIPPLFIQLTRTLLFLGAIIANRAQEPGIYDIPIEWQKELLAYMDRIFSAMNRIKKPDDQDISFQQPFWEKIPSSYDIDFIKKS